MLIIVDGRDIRRNKKFYMLKRVRQRLHFQKSSGAKIQKAGYRLINWGVEMEALKSTAPFGEPVPFRLWSAPMGRCLVSLQKAPASLSDMYLICETSVMNQKVIKLNEN